MWGKYGVARCMRSSSSTTLLFRFLWSSLFDDEDTWIPFSISSPNFSTPQGGSWTQERVTLVSEDMQLGREILNSSGRFVRMLSGEREADKGCWCCRTSEVEFRWIIRSLQSGEGSARSTSCGRSCFRVPARLPRSGCLQHVIARSSRFCVEISLLES